MQGGTHRILQKGNLTIGDYPYLFALIAFIMNCTTVQFNSLQKQLTFGERDNSCFHLEHIKCVTTQELEHKLTNTTKPGF